MFLRCFFLFAALFSTIPVYAGHAKISVDGASVYSRPDFDSEVVDFLGYGAQVQTSSKPVKGRAGLGVFYLVRTAKGKKGYVADTDLMTGNNEPVYNEKTDHRRKKREAEEEEANYATRPVYFTRYVGGSVSYADFSEKFQGNKLHQMIPFLGFRLTGPKTLFDVPTDFNIMISPKPPGYLSEVATGTASGFVILTDLDFMFPLWESRNSLWNYGLGLLLTYSQYSVQVGGNGYDSRELRMGIDFDLGYAYRITNYLLRFDFKYFIERSNYYGLMVSFQAEY